MNEPVKQHFVPKFYLKNFTTSMKDTGHLYVFDKSTGTWNPEPSTPKDEARAEHINSIFIDGTPSYMFDTFLTDIEDKAASIVHRIVTQRHLPPKQEDMAHLARFIASTGVRTPGHRSFYRQLVPMLFGSVVADLNAAETDPLSGLKSLLDQLLIPSIDEIFSDEALVAMIPGNTLYMAEIILRRKWHLILADKNGPHFVTSDNPVVGLLSQDIAMPLSPWIAVMASDQVETEFIQGDDRYIRALNWMTYDKAQSSIYAHEPDDLFLHDMEELGKKPQFKPEMAYLKEALQNP